MAFSKQLPSNIPCVLAGTIDFEVGFEQKYLVLNNLIDGLFCGICHGLPRKIKELNECGHIYCDSCLQNLVKLREESNPQQSWAHCPQCESKFSLFGLDIDYIPRALASVYSRIQINCPFGCGYQGNAMQVDIHQLEHCPNRLIQCPNINCYIIMAAQDMEHGHYPNCPQQRVTCHDCFLPVRRTDLVTHNCEEKRREVLQAFYNHFRRNGRPIPPLLREGVPLQPVFDIKPPNRRKFLDQVKKEDEHDMGYDEPDASLLSQNDDLHS